MKIYTARVDYWKQIVTNDSSCPAKPILLDVTVQNANTTFFKLMAPTWPMVRKYKAGTMSPEEYTLEYTDLLRKRFVEQDDWCECLKRWLTDLSKDDIAPIFACYCNAGDFCHRVLLIEWLIKFAKLYLPHIEITYGGELS